MTVRLHEVSVSPLPEWLDVQRLLGPTAFRTSVLVSGKLEARAEMPARDAASLGARLRGLGIDGEKLEVTVCPALSRPLVRAARTDEARARRDVSPGFTLRGVRLDEEGRFSLTPEALALEIGARVKGLRVVDVCCGSGGNSIGFARAGCDVVAIELDPARAADARHNAKVYGVAARIDVRPGDARALLPMLEADVAFIDPPWGRAYDKAGMGLADLPLLAELLPLCARFPRTLVKVPMSFDTKSVHGARAEAVFGSAAGDARRIKLVLLDLARGS